MAEFVLKNNVFEFNGTVKEQISGTAIGTKCALSYACIFMSEFVTSFIERQQDKSFIWFTYIDDTYREDKLKTFLEHLNSFKFVFKS